MGKVKKNLKLIISKYGFKNIIFSKDSVIFILFSIITFYLIKKIEFNNPIDLAHQFSIITLSIGTGLLAVVLTALSIIISMFTGEFWVRTKESYLAFCAPFLINCINWIILIVVSIAILVLTNVNDSKNILILLISLVVGILLSGLKGLLDLMITTIYLGLYKNVINK